MPTKLCDGAQMAIFWRFFASCIFSEPRAFVCPIPWGDHNKCVPYNCHCGTLVDAQGFTPWYARRHQIRLQGTMFSMTSSGVSLVLLGSRLSKSLLDLTGKMEIVQTGYPYSPLAGWTFAGLGNDSCQPVRCFLR